jgi:hypothetical protein
VVAGATLAALTGAGQSTAQTGAPQGQVVAAAPAAWTPNIDGGIVYAITQVGTTIVAGGTFTSATQHGTTTAVPNHGVVAFNATTGVLSTAFAPTLDGEVDAVYPGPVAGTVYLGGKFGTVNGAHDKGVALLNLSDGSLVAGFASDLNGQVQSIRVANGQLLLAGTFTTAGGAAHGGLASLNPTTGAVTPYLNVQLSGHHNYNGSSGSNGPVGAHAMDVTPDGTRAVVIGNFKNADGVLHDQIVMLDLSAASAVVDPNWNTNELNAPCASNAFDSYVEDVAFAPDGSYFALANTGGGGISHNADGTRSLCDSVSKWTMTDTGSSVQPTWVDYSGNDTFWSVTATGTAIYAGGHVRWMNNPNGSDSAAAGALPRPGIVALDPVSGLPLKWNPGHNPRGAGIYALFATPAGLWVGSDQNYFGNYTYKRDEIGFFPVKNGYTPASTATSSLPADVYLAGPIASTAAAGVLYRVNTGGPAVAATDGGPGWLADQSNSDPGATYRNHQSNSAQYNQISNVDSTVPASTPSGIFNSERWSPSDNPPMTWDFPVAAGTPVQVRLYFANRYSGTGQAGQRVFNVSLNGSAALSNFDIVASAGDQTGTMRSFNITVPSSGQYSGDVDIQFTHQVENPLVNGIEIVSTATPSATVGGPDDLAYRPMTTSRIGATTVLPPTGVTWSSTRGAFMVGSTIFYGTTAGTFFSAGFDGSAVGTSVAIDPYDDPYWDPVKTGSGTYHGVPTGYYAELPSVTGAFYSDGRMYYTLSGQATLFWRYFNPDAGVVGGQRFTVAGGNFANVDGMFVSTGKIYYSNAADGTLHTVSFSDGGTNGLTPSVDVTSDVVVSGPAIDGNDWRARGLFAFGPATFPDVPPTAAATGSCSVLNCSFDGTGSSDSDGSVASYAWDFGDGTTGTGATPTHGYAAAGTYTYTLTVTDNQGATSTPVSGQVTATALNNNIAPNGAAHGYAASATKVTVTTPAGVSTGDTELLYVSTSNTTANVINTPAGWTPVAQTSGMPLQVAMFSRVSDGTDAGTAVTVSVAAAGQLVAQLVDYSNVAAGTPVVATAWDSQKTAHVAPAVGVAAGGSWVVSFWADKSSTTTAWNLPGSVTQRDQTIGTGGGHVTAVIGDSGGPLPSGVYPPQTATINSSTASAKGVMISVVLAPAG